MIVSVTLLEVHLMQLCGILVQIEYLEFERHGAAGTSSISSHYFDLLIRLKSEQELQFRNIQRNEYHNLFNFIRYVAFYISKVYV